MVHADLVDRHGQMTITVNINNNLIARFLNLFTPGSSLLIKDLAIWNKGIYDRGDAKCFIFIQEKSTVEKIEQICKAQKIAPDTTIKSLSASNNPYSIGVIGAIVISCQQRNSQYELIIKDGQTIYDPAIVSFFKPKK